MESTDDLELLLTQQQQLQSKIEELKRKGRDQAVISIRDLANKYGLTSSELARLGTGGFSMSGSTGRTNKSSGPVAAKYRSPTGETWSGRGKRPNWLNAAIATGKNINDFLIASTSAPEFTRTSEPEDTQTPPPNPEDSKLDQEIKDLAAEGQEASVSTGGGKRKR